MIEDAMITMLGVGFIMFLLSEIFRKYFDGRRNFLIVAAFMMFVPIVYLLGSLYIDSLEVSEEPQRKVAVQKKSPKKNIAVKNRPKPIRSERQETTAAISDLPPFIQALIKDAEGDGVVITEVKKIEVKQ